MLVIKEVQLQWSCSNYYHYYLTLGAVSKPTSENGSSATGQTRGVV